MSDTAVEPAQPAQPAGPGAVGLGRRLLKVNVILLLLMPIGLLFFPRFIDNTTLLQVVATANIFVMFAASWDILSGYTGQVNFGHAAFIGFGAYTVALFSKYQPDVSNELALLIGTGTAALLGVAIGVPCLRLKGPYLALATLSVAGALVQLTFIYKEQTGGEDGIAGVKPVTDGAITGPIGEGLSKFVLGPLTFDGLPGFDQYIYVSYFVSLVLMIVMVGGLMLWATASAASCCAPSSRTSRRLRRPASRSPGTSSRRSCCRPPAPAWPVGCTPRSAARWHWTCSPST